MGFRNFFYIEQLIGLGFWSKFLLSSLTMVIETFEGHLSVAHSQDN